MSSSDSLESWIKEKVGINLNVASFEKDFSNGYYFGQILFQYGLNPSFEDIFINRHQGKYIKTNFTHLTPIMKEIKVPINSDIVKAIVKKEIGVAKKLLFKLKSVLTAEYEEGLKIESKTFMNPPQLSLHRKLKNRGVGENIKVVERKMVKFEAEYLRQKEMAAQRRREEEDRYRDMIQNHRQERLRNIRKQHNYMKEWDKQHYNLWKLTRKEQKEIKNRMKNFVKDMTVKIKAAELRKVERDKKDAEGGVRAFEDSAARLGIELEHYGEYDDIKKKKKKKDFNPIATMQKINNKNLKYEATRKEKESRFRRINVQQREAERELAKETEEKENLKRFVELSGSNLGKEFYHIVEEQREAFIKKNRKVYYENLEEQRKKDFKENLKKLKTMTDEEYQKKIKEVKFKKRVMLLEEREDEYKKNFRVCSDILDFMLEMTEECAQFLKVDEKMSNYERKNTMFESKTSQVNSTTNMMNSNIFPPNSETVSIKKTVTGGGRNERKTNLVIPEFFFQNLEDHFREFKSLVKQGDLISLENDKRSKFEKRKKLIEASKRTLDKYLNGKGSFRSPLTYGFFVKDENSENPQKIQNCETFSQNSDLNDNHQNEVKKFTFEIDERVDNKYFTRIALDVIDLSYPMKPKGRLPEGFPNHLPLKVMITGPPKSGKKTLGRELSRTLNLHFIDMDERIDYALSLARTKTKQDVYLLELKRKEEMEGAEEVPKKKAKEKKRGKKDEMEIVEFTEDEQKYIKIGNEIQLFYQDHEDNLLKNNSKENSEKTLTKNGEDEEGMEEENNLDINYPEIPKEIKFDLFKLELILKFPGMISLQDLNSELLKSKQEQTDLEAKAAKMKEQEAERQKAIKEKLKGKKRSKKNISRGKSANKLKTSESAIDLIDQKEYPFMAGFVLINFPKSLEEATFIDKNMVSFVTQEERLNKRAERRRKKLRLIMKVPERSAEKDAFPSFDLIIDLNTPLNELVDRLKNTKIDPSSEEIYNEILNPINKDDKKLNDRLVDLDIDYDWLEEVYMQFQEEILAMQKWYEQFGWELENGNVVNPWTHLIVDSAPDELIKRVKEKVQSLLKKKYSIYENYEKFNELFYENKTTKMDSNDEGTESKHSMTQFSSRLDRESKFRLSKNSYNKRNSAMTFNKRMDSKSVITNIQSRQEKLLKKCSQSLKNLSNEYIDRLLKCLRGIKEKLGDYSFFLKEKQKLFVGILERDDDSTLKIEGFLASFKRFILENRDVYEKPYTKKKLLNKVNFLQDFIWDRIVLRKNVSLAEKANLRKKKKIEKNVFDLLEQYLKILGCELNKVYYMKDMLTCYFAYKENKSEHELMFDVKKVDFVNQVLPEIDHDELVPVSRIEFIEENILAFYDEFEMRMEQNKERLPDEFIQCFKREIFLSRNRLKNVRAFVCHKIKKSKARYTAFLHRVEDWIVNTIKMESQIMYNLSNKIKDIIEKSDLKHSFRYIEYNPTDHHRIINFIHGPSGFYIPENDFSSPEIFDFTQLYLLFTDLKANLPLYKSLRNNGEQRIYHSIEIEKLGKILNFRTKNNKIGFVRYVPEYWVKIFGSKIKVLEFLRKFVELSSGFKENMARRRSYDKEKREEQLMDAADELEFDDEVAEVKEVVEGEEEDHQPEEAPQDRTENTQHHTGPENTEEDDLGGDWALPKPRTATPIEEPEDINESDSEISQSDESEISELDGDQEKFIRFEIFALGLLLLRYPLPEELDLEEYRQKLEKRIMSFEDFVEIPCWMDKFDERLVEDLSEDTLYKTAYTKRYLCWIFSNGYMEINTRRLIDALMMFVDDGMEKKIFFDVLTDF